MACGNILNWTIFVVFCAFISVNGQKSVIELNEETWKDMLKNEWMVKFYAPWCPACRGIENTWASFAAESQGLGIKVGKVDVTTSPGLSGRFMVTALPTIYHVLNGEFRQYKGSRDKDSFITFVEDKKWQQVEPVSSWKSPNSIQMTVVSSFFKLSQTLRTIHTKLMDEYGLPTWGSYLIFAMATIFLGAILGLVLVCVIDVIYPPKPITFVKASPLIADKKKSKDSDDELADEDIRDELLDEASQSDGDSDKQDKNKVKKRKVRRAD